MLHTLTLSRFRNLDHCQIEFSPGVNMLIGSNGQGKTNILEAVYYMALLRSFRTPQINDLKQWKSNIFRLAARCESGDLPPVDLEVTYGNERKLLVNGNPIYRTSEFINHFICVTFIPQDMELIRGGDVLRRRFLDIAISQLSPEYLRNLQAYHEALKSRNMLLKEQERFPRQVITAYDKVLVQKGIQVEMQRHAFVEKLNDSLHEKSLNLLEEGRQLSVKYLTGCGSLHPFAESSEEQLQAYFLETLDKSYERDCRDGYTHFGPHRSEMTCLLDKNSLLHFGSEGECRMASLAVKFGCLDIIRSQIDDQVTLLVDDVIGELDEQRQKNFFSELMKSGQIVMAGTYLPDFLKDTAKVFKVQAGKVRL